MTDIDEAGKDNQLGCFQSATRSLLKRKHSETEEILTKPKKKSIFTSISETLGFTRSISEAPKSILTANGSNRPRHLSSGEMNHSYQHDYHSFNVTNRVEHEHEVPPKKRVKFDEENLVYSSITYQRQQSDSRQMMVDPSKSEDSRSVFSKFVNFTASLF